MRDRKKFVVVVVVLVGCLMLALHTYAAVDEEVDMKPVVEGNNVFALNLYAKLVQEKSNLFFSPYSISTALAMTYAGARGETETQMADVLHFTLEQEALHPAFAKLSAHFQEIQQAGNVALDIANALWVQQDFTLLDLFLDTVKKYYQAGLFQVNFREAYEEVRIRINAWVEEKTNKKIQDLLAPGVLNELTRLVLTNAIYFKGNWAIEFKKDFTSEESFWVTPDEKVMVPMMHQENTFKYGENEIMQILQMPYKGEELSMVVLLPKDKDGLAQLEVRLAPDQLATWISEASMRNVQVFLPKFTLTSQCNLSGILQMMGMTDAFSGNADFSGIESEKQLSISEVIHKAFVEVNEEGTEAAAATAVVIGITAVAEPQPVPIFKADHPFIFFIRENQTGSLLFMGRIVNPAIS